MYKHFFKRLFDFVLSLLGLIIISPIFFLLWIWLTIANKGAGAFFYQQRPGKDEKIFNVIKFKTMTDDVDENGELLPDSARLTKIGIFVRSKSLDEIPQLINVFKGEMSLIGPRPLIVRYLPFYTNEEKLRHSVRPGITGLAQINGRNTLNWDERLAMDIKYVKTLSFTNDVLIIFKSITSVFISKGVEVDPTKIMKDLDEERKNKNYKI